MLQLRVRTRSNVAFSNRAKVEAVLVVAECDGALFLKGRCASERDLRLKMGLATTCRLEVAIEAIRSDKGRDRATRGGGGGFKDGSCLIGGGCSSLFVHFIY